MAVSFSVDFVHLSDWRVLLLMEKKETTREKRLIRSLAW